MVADPSEYRWSSFNSRIDTGDSTGWLDTDPCYLALGSTSQQRSERYKAFVGDAVSQAELSLIREGLQRGQLTGSSGFVDEVERIAGLRIERRGQGRPKASTEK
jgi:putative transposase|tara:strand:- start:1806 stop:2117 length:312 start_codon:yes stop_codon:yes gene_type:complete